MTPAATFSLLNLSHTVTLAIIVACCVLTPLAARMIIRHGWLDVSARSLAGLLVVHETLKAVVYIHVHKVPWIDMLPLHLCDVTIILCVIMLVTKSYRIYEICYFWAMGGSVIAVLTPELHYDFPHPIFILFFLGHALNILSVLFATFAFSFRPTIRSVAITLLVTAAYAALIMPLNFMLGTNFLYLNAKPSAPSVLDYFGPWPWYLPALVVLTVIACLLCYAPFALYRAVDRR